MNRNKILSVSVWVLIIVSIMAFWISLRSDAFAVEYGVIALVVWLAAMGLNYLKKKSG